MSGREPRIEESKNVYIFILEETSLLKSLCLTWRLENFYTTKHKIYFLKNSGTFRMYLPRTNWMLTFKILVLHKLSTQLNGYAHMLKNCLNPTFVCLAAPCIDLSSENEFRIKIKHNSRGVNVNMKDQSQRALHRRYMFNFTVNGWYFYFSALFTKS